MATELNQLDMLKYLMTVLSDHKRKIVECKADNDFTERTDGTYVKRELTGRSTITIVLAPND